MIWHLSSSGSESTISKPNLMETSNSYKNNTYTTTSFPQAKIWLSIRFPTRFVVSFGNTAEGLMTLGMYATSIWDRSPGWRCSGRTRFIFPWDLLMKKVLCWSRMSKEISKLIFFGCFLNLVFQEKVPLFQDFSEFVWMIFCWGWGSVEQQKYPCHRG